MGMVRLVVSQALVKFLVQNHGFASTGSLSESLGSQRIGTSCRNRTTYDEHKATQELFL